MSPSGRAAAPAPVAGDRAAALPMVAIEWSQRRGGVALACADGRRFDELRSDATGEELIVTIDRVMRRAGLEPRSLRSVAISIGPGGFTGLRVAVSTAKLLAEALGVALVAVPSALVAAAGVRGAPGDRALVLLAIKAARAGERSDVDATTWATPLVWSSGEFPGWRLETAEHGGGRLLRVATLPLASAQQVVGERALLSDVAAACDDTGIAWTEPCVDPCACLDAGLAQLAEHGPTDPLRLAPLYPREPEAVTLWQLRHGERG